MYRILIFVIMSLLTPLLLAFPSQGQTPNKVRIGWNYHLGNAPAVVAEQKGLFKKYGLEVEVRSFASGPSTSQALAAKEIDLAYEGFLPTYHAVDRGAQTMALVKSSYGLASIVVRKDSGITTLQELKGKTIAGSRKGSGNDVLLRGFLLRELANLEPDKDIQIVSTAPDAMGAPLLSRTVDSAMTLEPFTTQILVGEETKSLVNTVDVAPRHPWYLVVVRTDFLQQNRDLVLKAVKAHVEAVKYINANPTEANKLIAKAFKLSAVIGAKTEKITPLAEIIRLARERVGFDYRIADRDLEFFERQIRWSKALGFTKGERKAAEIFDLSVLKEVLTGK